jgi:putative flippase GtrA
MIKRELTIFLVVGFITVALDFLIYRGLLHLNLTGTNTAKAFGFIGGTFFAYFANRFWTFKGQIVKTGSPARFALAYIISLTINILVNRLSIATLQHFVNIVSPQYLIHFSFFLATGISATTNFIGMKFYVFTNRTNNP